MTRPLATAARVQRFADLEALSRAAAAEFVAISQAAVDTRGHCAIALSGGATPRRLLQLLAGPAGDALPWAHLDWWWGDERTVAPDHRDSNYRMAREALLAPRAVAASCVHRISGEHPDHDAAALTYEGELCHSLGEPPVLDLALLGLGSDGHTASLFPHSPALAADRRWVVANRVSSPLVGGSATRITMTAATLLAARKILVLVAGVDKAAALAAVLCGAPDPHQYPAQLIAGSLGEVRWLVDEAAASQLGGTT
jgi:6-phosphogluconolactonase